MLPEDDYLRLKPIGNDARTSLRIALMALMGCLILISALVVQSHAKFNYPIHPRGFYSYHAQTPKIAEPAGLKIIVPQAPTR